MIPHSWYAREVHRQAIDQWLRTGTSLRRAVEWVRSLWGRQERWQLWQPWTAPPPEEQRWRLAASTLCRWLDRAGLRAQGALQEQMAGVPCSGQMGADGLWARLRGGGQRVVLMLSDSVSGLVWPAVVALGEQAEAWRELLWRAQEAGLDLLRLKGITSDGALGLKACLRREVAWVQIQRCVFHLWRQMGGELRHQAARAARSAVAGEAERVGSLVRRELEGLVRGVLDAASYAEAEAALQALLAHRCGAKLGRWLREELDSVLTHLHPECQGLSRVGPEWLWRDFRLRLSRGRNHGSAQRLERAVLLWGIYHNLTPTQRRSERKRHYKHPGLSPLEAAGHSPGDSSYLDALGI